MKAENMKAEKLNDKYVRLQQAFLNNVTPSLLSASFCVLSDDRIQVLLVYRATLSDSETKQSKVLEDMICQVFENRAFTEKKILSHQDEPIQLEWPIFMAKQQTED
ncbi:hypothetical protein PN36_20765 [Candidatus Thiomargarita nelsonii]|uniref:Uncharacterized protein n=1 Tax=Candidatus Thiomargarita nelsonii TaxID=1003181 RepID=A0A0A6PAT6_9GAMM|nr:hypothetical protein PN36_20765 [Candidatus Thiomargarita nelsonii]